MKLKTASGQAAVMWAWRQLEVIEVRMGCSCLAAGGRLEDIMRLPCTALGQYSPTPEHTDRNNMFSSTSTSKFVKTHLIESIQFVIFHFYTSHLHPSFFRFLVFLSFLSTPIYAFTRQYCNVWAQFVGLADILRASACGSARALKLCDMAPTMAMQHEL